MFRFFLYLSPIFDALIYNIYIFSNSIIMYEWPPLNTLGPIQNGCYSPEAFSNAFCWNENIWILIRMSLKFVLNSPIGNILALAVIMAWPLTFYLIAHLPWYIHNGDYTREFKWRYCFTSRILCWLYRLSTFLVLTDRQLNWIHSDVTNRVQYCDIFLNSRFMQNNRSQCVSATVKLSSWPRTNNRIFVFTYPRVLWQQNSLKLVSVS